MQIVLATSNAGKIAELARMLAPAKIEVIGLDQFAGYVEPEENGASFLENAVIKARAACLQAGVPALADDSGLCVDALGGEPGIHSARYGTDWKFLPGESRDERNIRKLLYAMEKNSERKCRFVTAVAAARPDGRILTREGIWEGLLLRKPKGCNGFGYDPVFFDPVLHKAAAELTAAEKNARSHRGNAMRALLKDLPAFLAD